MRRLNILVLCLCLALSSTVVGKARQDNKSPVTTTTIQNGFPNVFRVIGNFFKKLIGKKHTIIVEYTADVRNVTLSRTEVMTACSINENVCSEQNQSIEVFTDGYDHENDVLTYLSKVSGGKIIGEGAKVVWDLSGEKPGTYTITAGVDDGCGVCGKTMTKEIKVVVCAECN